MKRILLAVCVLFALCVSAYAQPTIFVYNAGSQTEQSPTAGGGTPYGSIGTMYISNPIFTDENVTFSPWQTSTSGGFKVTAKYCGGTSSPYTAMDLPLLSVNTIGSGAGAYNQVNFYMPNNTGTESFGTCDPKTYPALHFDVTPKTGFNSNNVYGTYFGLGIDAELPGAFTWQHYNVTTATYTAAATCTSNPSACPVKTSGVPNYLIFYTTGAEVLSLSDAGLKIGGVYGSYWMADSITVTGTGTEQINVPIPNGTSAGGYTVQLANIAYDRCSNCPQTGFDTWFPNISISLGAAN